MPRVRRLLQLPVCVLLVAACTREPDSSGVPAPAMFSEITEEAGIAFTLERGATGARYLPEIMLGGVAWIDYDGDGAFDLYAVNGHAEPFRAQEPGKEANRLFRNRGDGSFEDVTVASGTGDRRYGLGAAVGDYDNDGDSDLLVTNFGRNTLYRNRGDGTFADATEEAGVMAEGFHASAAWFDMESDGDLDLFVVRYLRYDPRHSKRCDEEPHGAVYCHPRFFSGEPDLLYRNRGDGTFEDISESAGIARGSAHEGKGLGVAVFDYDRDGLSDIYVANDTTPNFLWHANGDGTYSDHAATVGVALSAEGLAEAGMGVDVGDANLDARSDLYVTNFSSETNALYLGREDGSFEERNRAAGLGASYRTLGFGTLFVDADLDFAPDLIVLNGHVNDRVETTDAGRGVTYRQRPQLWRNDGNGQFLDANEKAGRFFQAVSVGRGLAAADFDNDGDVDLACMTLDQSLRLLRNDTSAPRSLVLQLRGTRSNRDGYGARVEAHVGPKRRVFEYQSARSYLSASDPRLVIGLKGASRIDLLRVHWPSGAEQELRNLESSQEALLIVEPLDAER